MLLIGVAGTELSAQERDWLQHDAVAGVVLFTRNFASRTQVAALSASIRAAAPRPVLICVDQKAGAYSGSATVTAPRRRCRASARSMRRIPRPRSPRRARMRS